MKLAVSLPNVGDPGALVEFAAAMEAVGIDAVLLWDGFQHQPDALDTIDPWTLLGAMAWATDRIRLGTGVTPISRRQPWKLGKELITLDHLSRGRAVLAVGLGAPDEQEFHAFGDRASLRERASRTDEGLEVLDQLLRGERVDHDGVHHRVHAHLRPPAHQSPRPPIWIAATAPHRRPLERAKRWDGVYLNVKIHDDEMPMTPGEVRDYLGEDLEREGFEVVTIRHPAHDVAEYETLGVDCLVEGWWPRGDGWLAAFRRHVERLVG